MLLEGLPSRAVALERGRGAAVAVGGALAEDFQEGRRVGAGALHQVEGAVGALGALEQVVLHAGAPYWGQVNQLAALVVFKEPLTVCWP